MKHLNGQSLLHFYHHRCELKLINNVTTSIRFFQDIIHEKKDFASRFCIHIIPEPRPFKHYNYFNFFDFFEFYQIHKQTYALNIGNAFHVFLTENETEIFTTFEKYNDINGPYKGVFDYRVYFLVHKNGQINTLKSPTRLNVYIPETFGKVLKRDNDKILFDVLVKHEQTYDRETIFTGMRENVQRYRLKAFYTEYNNLDTNYWSLTIDSLQGTTQPLERSLFAIRIIKEGIVRKKKDFTLTDITRDERLLKLLPERSSDYFILSNFYNEFSNFQLENDDFVKTKGFVDSSYQYSEAEITKYFTIDIIHSSVEVIHYHFDFLPIFKYAKARGLGENFGRIFYSYLKENDTDVFTTEEKYGEGKKDKIIYVVNKYSEFKFLGSRVVPYQGPYGIYQYIPETFYNILVKSNKELKNSYSMWHWISKNTLTQGTYYDPINKTTVGRHLVLRRKTENLTDERGIRLFYAKSGLGYQPLENSLAPIQEIFSFSANATSTENKNYFAERIRDFEKMFPDEQKIYAYDIQKKKN